MFMKRNHFQSVLILIYSADINAFRAYCAAWILHLIQNSLKSITVTIGIEKRKVHGNLKTSFFRALCKHLKSLTNFLNNISSYPFVGK